MNFYDRDPSLPYWLANVEANSLFENHSHRLDRAQAWLRYRNVSESCTAFGQAVLMRGHFEAGSLGAHTYQWTFTPTYLGQPAIVLPVHEQGRLVDLVAIARHDYRVWGCCTGTGQYVGKFVNPLPVHDTPYSWLMGTILTGRTGQVFTLVRLSGGFAAEKMLLFDRTRAILRTA